MKFLVAILAIQIFLLSFRPIEMSDSRETAILALCCEEGCSAEEGDHHNQEKKGDDCCGEACNPFQSCCAFVVTVPQVAHHFTNKFIALSNTVFVLSSDPLPTGSMVDFWQPPRFV